MQGREKEMGFDPTGQSYPGNPGQWPPRNQPQQPPYQGQWPPPQPPQWQPQGPQFRPPPRRRKSGAGWIFGSLCLLAVIIVIAIVAAHGGSSSSSAPPAAGGSTAAPAATSAPAAAAGSTVTYVVTGSSADVTYGPAGSSLSGSVPMRKTAAIPASAPAYYAITAQLNGPGTVTCEILVGGKVISKSTATGSYNIADCEITQDPLSGNWADANSA